MLDRQFLAVEFLVVGCGCNDKNSFEKMKHKVTHESLHPSTLFDTLDISQEVEPTYVKDINNLSDISTIREEKYSLVIYERFPTEYFSKNAALSAAHLTSKNGMVTILPTGQRIILFKQLILDMKEAGFQTAVVSPLANVIFFFKTDNKKNALATLNQFIEHVSYVAQLFQDDGLLRAVQADVKLTTKNIADYVWNTEDLYKKYQDELSSLNSQNKVQEYLTAPQLKSILLTTSAHEISDCNNNTASSTSDCTHDLQSIQSISMFAQNQATITAQHTGSTEQLNNQRQPVSTLAEAGVWHWFK